MTDAQLAALLYQIAARLNLLLIAAEAGLPEELKEDRPTLLDIAFKYSSHRLSRRSTIFGFTYRN